MSHKLSEVKELSGLTNDQLAKALGYSKGQKIYDIARGLEGMSKPAETAMNYFSQGILTDAEKNAVPEFVFGERLGDSGADTNYLIRMWFPRFFGVIIPPDGEYDGLDEIKVSLGENGDLIVVWMDNPVRNDEREQLARAAQFLKERGAT